MNLPRISVLVPCFNDGQWLDEAIESVFAQTFDDFEIIIVDDGSTDSDTVRKLAAYSAPRTRVFHTDNRGLPAARNCAAAHAAGEMFCALDADDVLAPTWFEKSVGMLDAHPDLAFVSHWLEAFGDEQWVWQPLSCDLQSLLVRNTVNGAALVRRAAFEAVGGYDENMRDGCEDWDFWLRLVERGFRGTILPQVLFYYRRRAESMSRRMLEPEAYRKPLTALVNRHASAYRTHMSHVLLSKEVESVNLFREVWNLQRDQIAITAPSLSRAREELDAATAKAEALTARLGPHEPAKRDQSSPRDLSLAKKISTLEGLVAAGLQHAGKLEHLLAEARQHATNLERRVAELDPHASALDRRVAELTPHAAALEHRVAELSRHAAGLESDRAELTRWVGSLQRERDEASASAARAHEAFAELRTEFNALRNSYSWTITSPFRALRGWLARFQ
jgi:glycosyltransferase involved in cell wall biosynthesis